MCFILQPLIMALSLVQVANSFFIHPTDVDSYC